MHDTLEFASFLTIAAVFVLLAVIVVSERLRERQDRENLKTNGRRR